MRLPFLVYAFIYGIISKSKYNADEVPLMRKYLGVLLVILVIFSMVSCQSNIKVTIDEKNVLDTTSTSNYFPKGAFSKVKKVDEFENNWFSTDLKIMEEPSLYQWSRDESVFRLLYLPALFRYQVSLRVILNIKSNTGMLYYKCIDEEHGFPGKLIETRTIELNADKIKHLTDVLKEKEFSSLPTYTDEHGLDGSDWVIEGVENHKYKLIVRWLPEETDTTVYVIGQAFIDLIGKDNLWPKVTE